MRFSVNSGKLELVDSNLRKIKTIKEKQREIEQLRESLAVQTKLAQKFEEDVKAKDEMVVKLNREVSHKEKVVTKLKEELKSQMKDSQKYKEQFDCNRLELQLVQQNLAANAAIEGELRALRGLYGPPGIFAAPAPPTTVATTEPHREELLLTDSSEEDDGISTTRSSSNNSRRVSQSNCFCGSCPANALNGEVGRRCWIGEGREDNMGQEIDERNVNSVLEGLRSLRTMVKEQANRSIVPNVLESKSSTDKNDHYGNYCFMLQEHSANNGRDDEDTRKQRNSSGSSLINMQYSAYSTFVSSTDKSVADDLSCDESDDLREVATPDVNAIIKRRMKSESRSLLRDGSSRSLVGGIRGRPYLTFPEEVPQSSRPQYKSIDKVKLKDRKEKIRVLNDENSKLSEELKVAINEATRAKSELMKLKSEIQGTNSCSYFVTQSNNAFNTLRKNTSINSRSNENFNTSSTSTRNDRNDTVLSSRSNNNNNTDTADEEELSQIVSVLNENLDAMQFESQQMAERLKKVELEKEVLEDKVATTRECMELEAREEYQLRLLEVEKKLAETAENYKRSQLEKETIKKQNKVLKKHLESWTQNDINCCMVGIDMPKVPCTYGLSEEVEEEEAEDIMSEHDKDLENQVKEIRRRHVHIIRKLQTENYNLRTRLEDTFQLNANSLHDDDNDAENETNDSWAGNEEDGGSGKQSGCEEGSGFRSRLKELTKKVSDVEQKHMELQQVTTSDDVGDMGNEDTHVSDNESIWSGDSELI